jgi:hypothetical protein
MLEFSRDIEKPDDFWTKKDASYSQNNSCPYGCDKRRKNGFGQFGFISGSV